MLGLAADYAPETESMMSFFGFGTCQIVAAGFREEPGFWASVVLERTGLWAI
jgi:hypothetical protein